MTTELNATTKVRPASDGGWGIGMAVVASLVGPFILWPIERLVPGPVWIEEVYKLWLVWLLLRSTSQNRLFWVFVVGLGFGSSETILYLMNFLQSGSLAEWGLRFVTTVPMHAFTTVIHYGGWVVGVGPLGILPAGLIHQWFNSVV